MSMEEPKMSAAEAERVILIYERNVNEALRRLRNRTNYEPAADSTPLYDLIGKEDGDRAGGDDESERYAWAIRNEALRVFFAYVLGDGPHPAQILRRIFAIGAHMMIEPFCLLNLRERAMMLGDSHGAQHWRTKRICTDPLLRKGAKSFKAPGQKSAAAAASAAIAQQGNSNRANDRAVVGQQKQKPKKKTKPNR